MRSLLIAKCFVLMSMIAAYAVDLPPPPTKLTVYKAPPVVQQPCPPSDAKCLAYKRAASKGPVPYAEETLCVYFRQPQVDNVVIKFYDQSGRELAPNNKLHWRLNAKTEDKICPGLHWFVKAHRVEICNSTAGRPLTREHIKIMFKEGRTPVGKWVYIEEGRG